ncbi:MAG: MCE family protein [Chlorobiota bacterium]|nr:MAG: MCE family protein [Chlorobiota bacterium]
MYGTEQRTYIKVGAIALVAVILLLAGITIGRGLNFATATAEVRIRAATAAGLEPGAPVWINGIKRGSVLSVRPEGDSVLIIVGLDDTSMLRRDARAQIAMLEITGGKRVDILPGTSPARWEGQALPADAPADIAEVLSIAHALARQAQRVLEQLDTTIYAANALLADPNVQAHLRQTLARAASLSSQLDSLVAASRATIETTIADVGSASRQLRELIEHNRSMVERLLERLDRTGSKLETLIGDGARLAASADTTLGELNQLLATLRQQRSALGKLLYDESLGGQLESSLRRLAGVVDTISRYGINVNVRLGTRP